MHHSRSYTSASVFSHGSSCVACACLLSPFGVHLPVSEHMLYPEFLCACCWQRSVPVSTPSDSSSWPTPFILITSYQSIAATCPARAPFSQAQLYTVLSRPCTPPPNPLRVSCDILNPLVIHFSPITHSNAVLQ